MTQQDSVTAAEAISRRPAAASRRADASDSILQRLGASAYANRVDIAIVATITAVAAALRLWDLGTIPSGLHGDEAWTGLDGRIVFAEGEWIGAYVPSALGQPTGPLHLTWLLFLFMPETTFTVRFSMALFAIATFPLAYLAFAQMFNRTVAAFAIAILVGLMWHLHLSRTGFMVTSWPFAEMAVLAALWVAFRTRSVWWWLATGVLLGLGVYTYNTYFLFVPVVMIAIGVMFFYVKPSQERMRFVMMAGALGLVAWLFATPLLREMVDDFSVLPPDLQLTFEYGEHQRVVGLTHQPQWDEADWSGRAEIIWDRAKELNHGLLHGDRPDYGDGLAAHDIPLVHPLIYFIALGGLGMAVWNIRKPESAVLVAAIVLLPWGSLMTVGDGVFRRATGLTPFIAVLAALPLAWIWQRAWDARQEVKYAALAGVLLVPAYAGIIAARQYFGPVQDSVAVQYIYADPLEAYSRYIDGNVPREAMIYFYSDRWSFSYETRRFHAPDSQGVDRSPSFRDRAAERRSEPLDFSIERGRPAVFVLLAPYQQRINEITAMYPGGRAVQQTKDEEVLFIAYFVPEQFWR